MSKAHFNHGIYTHVGSRTTPDDVCIQMMRFARLQRRIPRSGGAKAADESAESNPQLINYLPYVNFRQKGGIWSYTDSELRFADRILTEVYPENIRKLRHTTLEFFRRNVFQVLGLVSSIEQSVEEESLSDFVLCWTPNGEESMEEYVLGQTGGTGIAINVASLFSVPVHNIRNERKMQKLKRFCEKKEREWGLRFDSRTGKHYYGNTRVEFMRTPETYAQLIGTPA